MATFTTWLLQLGNAGAARNAGVACELRRANHEMVAAACADLAQRYDRALPAGSGAKPAAARTAA